MFEFHITKPSQTIPKLSVYQLNKSSLFIICKKNEVLEKQCLAHWEFYLFLLTY